ncbi:flagellin [Nitrosopumilus adriaticus]|uniref:Putative Archaeal flagellar protein FlaG n=1 Tax=Nitrosopumilus adriaticus TaxID=1580092 RepID=A0A0D5C1B0_9ARCH|nr:flagellin [Nitrosopumilus adriaticus]AJW70506.1 putative Archaeal flagellar protein FlaG [Nitrosopumilus adriaticus]
MSSGMISEGILIIASIVVAGLITGIVVSKVGTFEGYYTANTEAQKDKMLSKFEIIHVSKINNTSVKAWIKNTGLTPIRELDSVDVYFGPITSVNYVGYSSGSNPQWSFNGTKDPSSVWNQGETIQIQLQDDSALQTSTSYLIQFTISNGESNDHIFSVS